MHYSLKRWAALSRYLNDGTVPIDNNHIEQQIRPWALGRKNWLFAGSLRSGQRAAALMSLIQSTGMMRMPIQKTYSLAHRHSGQVRSGICCRIDGNRLSCARRDARTLTTVRPSFLLISRALDYSLKRWAELSRYLNGGAVPLDNNWAGNQIRSWGAWTQKLALRRVVAQRKTGCGNHEPDSVGTHERA